MNTKLLIGLAVALGLIALAFLGAQVERAEPEPDVSGELIGGGYFILEQDGRRLIDEEYTVFFHPIDGYMLLSQGRLYAGDDTIGLAQQAQFDRDYRPVFYHLAADTPSGTQIISAQMGLTGLAMEVRFGSSSQEAVIADATNLALLDNNLIAHYAILLMAIRAEAIDRSFTAAIPQALLSLPARVDGPNAVEFLSGDSEYTGKRFDVFLGDTQIVLIEYLDRLVALVNVTQGTVGYEAGLFPDGVRIPVLEEAAAAPPSVDERTMTFASGELTLEGTLALPTGAGPHPAVLFLHGSGPVDRDGNAAGMRMDAYRQLAHALAANGIASLRYDKRGVGASEGDVTAASMTDLVADATAALASLGAQEDIDPASLFLVGHSEGAYLAPLVFQRTAPGQSIAGIGLLAGAARPLDEITWWQIETMLRQSGAADEQIEAARAQQNEYFAFVEGSTGEWSDHTNEDLQAGISWLSDVAAEQLRATPLGLSWLREHYTADTQTALAAVSVPVLALNGEKDLQVPAAEAEAIAAVLADAGNEAVTVHVLPDLNHLLRFHPEEPNLLVRHTDEPVDQRVIDLLVQWVNSIVGR